MQLFFVSSSFLMWLKRAVFQNEATRLSQGTVPGSFRKQIMTRVSMLPFSWSVRLRFVLPDAELEGSPNLPRTLNKQAHGEANMTSLTERFVRRVVFDHISSRPSLHASPYKANPNNIVFRATHIGILFTVLLLFAYIPESL